ncbi:MAG: hypothetical protein K2X90_02435 [Candidatus Babeliaceae bacterium]|nr:hypothetical protein [Candidatus Babeliaceae bacterium]
MKKLWITGVTLSIFLASTFLKAQENLVQNRGKGTCWTSEKDKNGFEIYRFHPTTTKCGYFVAYQIPRDTAGSDRGWPSGLPVKIVNIDHPENVWYLGLGPFENQRALKFGKDAKMACYGCQPKMSGIRGNLPINCSPNDGDPAKRAACFTGIDALDCSMQIDCSKVVDITECYQKAVGSISSAQFNDLKLCGERDMGENYGPGRNSAISSQTAATVQQQGEGALFGPKAGAQNLSNQTGLIGVGG